MTTSKNRHKAFSIGYQFQKYRIQSILRQGKFNLTYLANDIQSKRQIVLKEYLPGELVERKDDYTLQPKTTQDADNFELGLEQFVQEARILKAFNHPNIVHVQRLFQANNTAYLVMDYEQGQSLAELFKENKIVNEEELIAMLPPLLNALQTVHKANYLHCNIKPETIYLRDKDQSPVLIGFGVMSYNTDNSNIAATITTGYTPFEQYQTKGNQGPWTDIYALGAVLYWLVSGTVPNEAVERIDAIVYGQPDPLPSLAEIGDKEYSKELLEAIDWALETRDTERPQTVDEWAKAIPPKFLPPILSSSQPKKRVLAWILVIAILSSGGYLLYIKWQHTPTISEKTKPLTQLKPQKIKPLPLAELPPPAQPIMELQPEEQLIEQSIMQIKPAQFIKSYYTAISSQQYDTSWIMLSRRFKDKYHCCKADGSHDLNSYLKWWTSIKKVEVLTMKMLEHNAKAATVKAELRYFFKDENRVIMDTHTFNLVADMAGSWLIEEQI